MDSSTTTGTTTTTTTISSTNNIKWHNTTVSQDDRWKIGGHRGAVIWLTGLSGSGKSSVANAVESILSHKYKIRTYLLDGDNIRHGLCQDLGFSENDRTENVRRVGQVSKLMADSGVVTLAALVSPYRSDRDNVRKSVEGEHKHENNDVTSSGDNNNNNNNNNNSIPFIEIYVNASLQTCEGRDPKGLYKLAREGKIKNFTGIDDPYEEPTSPELILDSNTKSIEELAEETCSYILDKIKL